MDGQPVDLVIVLDLARSVDPGEVIFVHTVLHDEEQQPWGRRGNKIRTVYSTIAVWCLPNGVMRGQLKLYNVTMENIIRILA